LIKVIVDERAKNMLGYYSISICGSRDMGRSKMCPISRFLYHFIRNPGPDYGTESYSSDRKSYNSERTAGRNDSNSKGRESMGQFLSLSRSDLHEDGENP